MAMGYNFVSVTCLKNDSSLIPLKTASFLRRALQFSHSNSGALSGSYLTSRENSLELIGHYIKLSSI
jgi:hypothetical protein